MRKLFFLLLALVFFSSHDMFLKLDGYFLVPNTVGIIKLFNGTFEKSDNTIDRGRMIDVSLVGNGKRISVDTAQWSELGGVTILNFNTGEPGTWVAGVSTRPRNIEMEAAAFNEYLEHDGVLDMLDWRKANNALDRDAVERYSKHVKTIFQVGDQKTDDWQTSLDYPIEFIPMTNPYDLHPGDSFKVKLLWQGAPLANQLVYIGSEHAEHTHDHSHAAENGHAHDHDNADHHHHPVLQARTDSDGIFAFNVEEEGIWYLRTIHLVQSTEPGLTHESNWATLTFEVGHTHDHSSHDHDHDHDHDHESSVGIPSYVYWGGSFLVILGLFFWFNRKTA